MESYERFAHIYDALMNDVDYDKWAEYVISFLVKNYGDKKINILECACGTGAVTIRMAKRGYNIIGSDLSEDMLEVASEKARRNRLNIHFIRQDMTCISLHKRVDAVISCCDGVNYLTSREKLLKFFSSAYDALKDNGLLLFDISSRYKLSTILANNTFGENQEDNAYIWKNIYDETNKLIEMNLTFFSRKGELFERFSETHIQRAHSVREISGALNDAGFELVGVYNAFTLDEADDKSERIQFVAKKLVK